MQFSCFIFITFSQAMCVYYIGISNFCFDTVFCIMAVHLAGQFRILQYRFTKLCDTDNQICKKNLILEEQMQKFHEKFKKYVRRHQALIDYHQKLENVYTTIMLSQVLLFSVLICLFGYQVLLVGITNVFYPAFFTKYSINRKRRDI